MNKSVIKRSILFFILSLVVTSYSYSDNSDLSIGAWRIVFEKTDEGNQLKTFAKDLQSVVSESYPGTERFHWRFKKQGTNDSTYTIANEIDSLCLLSNADNSLSFGSCDNNSAASWFIHKVRAATADRAGLYQLQSASTENYLINNNGAPKLSSLENSIAEDSTVYIEEAGWGERKQSPAYEIKSLLLVLKYTDIPNITAGSLADDTIENIRIAYEEHLPSWIAQITDGKVKYSSDVIVSDIVVTAMEYQYISNSINRYLPAAKYVQEQINSHILKGKYDVIQTVFTPGDNGDGGWGWSPSTDINSKYAIWNTVNGKSYSWNYYLGDTTSRSEPVEVFMHEPLHGYDRYVDNVLKLDILPDGDLHGGEQNGYSVNLNQNTSYLHWMRDYWLGKIIGENGYYKGLGENIFSAQSVRLWAGSTENAEFNFIHSGGKCLSSLNSANDPALNSPVVLSKECSTLGQSFVLLSNGSIQHQASGNCIHPLGGTANVGTKLVLYPNCENEPAKLSYEITNDGSLRHKSTGFCIHPQGGNANPSEGTNLVLWDSCNEPKLAFNYVRKPFNFVHSSGKCVSTDGDVTAPQIESNITLSEECGKPAQNFRLLDNGSIQHVASGQCVHPLGGKASVGSWLVLWPTCDGEAEKLEYEMTSFGSIKHKSTGYCVHPNGGSANPADGTKLVLWDICDESRLSFEYVESR